MNMKTDNIYSLRKDFFNKHAAKWDDMWYRNDTTGQYNRYKKNFERLFSLIPLKKGDHVLDAGCGTGILVPFILEHITSEGILYELDFAENMLKVNKNLHKETNIRFVLADVENAPLDNESCNVIICFSSFPHFHNKEKAMMALSRILKKNGFLIVAHFDSSQGINKHHASCKAVMYDRLPDKHMMETLFHSTGLNILQFIDETGFYYISARK